jgi:hypothetical protein
MAMCTYGSLGLIPGPIWKMSCNNLLVLHTEQNSCPNIYIVLGLCCLTPLSTTFQFYRDDQLPDSEAGGLIWIEG